MFHALPVGFDKGNLYHGLMAAERFFRSCLPNERCVDNETQSQMIFGVLTCSSLINCRPRTRQVRPDASPTDVVNVGNVCRPSQVPYFPDQFMARGENSSARNLIQRHRQLETLDTTLDTPNLSLPANMFEIPNSSRTLLLFACVTSNAQLRTPHPTKS